MLVTLLDSNLANLPVLSKPNMFPIKTTENDWDLNVYLPLDVGKVTKELMILPFWIESNWIGMEL